MSAVWATILEAILSPRAHMAFSGGPMKAMLFLINSSGSLGFSEAWPQPAQTACTWSERERKEKPIRFYNTHYSKCYEVFLWYLHTLCNVQNKLNISIIIVVGSTRDWHVVVSHFDILRVSCSKSTRMDNVSIYLDVKKRNYLLSLQA